MKAVFTTPRGDITVTLFDQVAPNTVANFVKLAKSGFYEGLAFHRVIANFMIQGGCPHSKEGATGHPGTGGPGYKIKCEINPEKHLPGTLSMAHAGPNTGGSQFFITHGPQPHLDGRYAVFGHVVSGMEAVDRLRRGDAIKRVRIWDGVELR